ncbi:MAG: glucosaminidase domain-containing protein [Tannerellaceae bacterium]|nr:glucosaminidase domain-containing protein [Tannerellaceae bacterium]
MRCDEKKQFIEKCFSWAQEAGRRFDLNPVVILAQAALESGWGTSTLATRYHSYFGVTGSGSANAYWDGQRVWFGNSNLSFRTYADPLDSFLDYAWLIRARYPNAANVSDVPEAFARAIAYSPYISEVNGDDREGYQQAVVSIAGAIERLISEL